MSGVPVAAGAPTEFSGRIVSLGLTHVRSALEGSAITEQEREFLLKHVRRWDRKAATKLATRLEAAKKIEAEHERKTRQEDRLAAKRFAAREAAAAPSKALALARRAAITKEFLASVREAASLAEPKGHMAELAEGWIPEWVVVP